MLIKKFFICLGMFLMVSLYSYCEIKSINHISEIKEILESVNSDTLVVFDIDRTLIMMGDQVLTGGKTALKEKIAQFIASKGLPSLSQEKMNDLVSVVL